MRSLRQFAITGATLVFTLAASFTDPSPARACSRPAPPPALQTIPADGASDVPTNVHITIDTVAFSFFDTQTQTATFDLTDAAGQAVPFAMGEGFIQNIELVPNAALTANTRYTLRARLIKNNGITAPQADLSMTFTTGAGPLATRPLTPAVSMQHYAMSGTAGSSCGPSATGTCVSLPADQTVVVTYIDEFGQEVGFGWSADGERPIPYLRRGPFFTDLSGIAQGTNFRCAKVRARALDGSVSDPVVLCGAAATTFSVTSEDIACTAAGLTVGGVPAASTSRTIPTARPGDGCSIAGGAAGPSWFALAALAAALVTRRSRRVMAKSVEAK